MSYVCRCIAHRIHVLNLPAHTTHLLQVADISVFGPFKNYLRSAKALAQYQRNGSIKPQHIAALTKPAWERAITRANVITGFAKAGIVPYDRTKITDKIYKQGARLRQFTNDSSRFAVPPVPPLPRVVLDSSSSSPAPLSSPPVVVEAVESILTRPDPLPLEPSTHRHHNGLNTTYAVMLSQETIITQLTERKEQKEQKQKDKDERKRERKRRNNHQSTHSHNVRNTNQKASHSHTDSETKKTYHPNTQTSTTTHTSSHTQHPHHAHNALKINDYHPQ